MGDHEKITLKIMVNDKVVATISELIDFDVGDFEWFKEELGLSCERLSYMLTEAKEISRSPWLDNDRTWTCHVGNNWYVNFDPNKRGEVIARRRYLTLPRKPRKGKVRKNWKDPAQYELPFPKHHPVSTTSR